MPSSIATRPPAAPRASTLSAEVAQVLDMPPVWIVRWGNVLLLVVLLASLLIGSLVPYPDTISGKAVVEGGSLASGRVTLPAADAPRIHLGQRVIITLNAFSDKKYGALTGRVATVPVACGVGLVMVRVMLDQGYRTTYGQRLPVRGRSAGFAHLAVADQRLFARLLQL